MSELALKLIAENKKTKAKSLDLGNCGLAEVPEEVGELVWLEELILCQDWYEWEKESGDWKGLIYRKSINGGVFNRLESLPRFLSNLVELKKIVLSGKPKYRIKVSNLNGLEGCKKLEFIFTRYTSIENIDAICSLKKLKSLDIGHANLSDIVPIVSFLHEIERLDLRHNMISSIDGIEKLKNLKFLNLNGNNITHLKPVLPFLIQGFTIVSRRERILEKQIKFDGVLNLIEPPPSIVLQGNSAIALYYDLKEKQGTQILTEAKIVIVGAGESGKTTLVQKLLNPEHPVPNPDDKRTEGVRITQYPMQNDLTAHLWDFGGQELYHTTHQFFLTPDTLYLLLNDNRKNDTDFYYWLNILALRAGDKCPILTIFNAKDGAPRQILPDETLFQHFPGLLREAVDVDFADKDLRRFNELKDHIEQHFAALPSLGKPFPAFWVRVREALGRRAEEHISWAQFRDNCQAEKIEDEVEMRTLAQTLHNLGVLLWFPDVFGLDDLLVLQPQWCIDAVYKALDTKAVRDNFGQFSEADLHAIWRDERYRSQCNRLLKLMQHFDLCYPVEGSPGAFIAPQLLDLRPNPDPDFSAESGITHRFQYEFMPAGLLTRFIARMSRHIHAPHVWRTGVVLRCADGTAAEVTENQFGKEITMRVSGPERKRRLSEMRQTLESIHSGFRGLKYEEKVACNCPDCAQSPQPSLFVLNELEQDAKHGGEAICRNKNWKKIPAQSILDGIEYRDTPRIFISYAPDDRRYMEEFTTMLAPLRKNGDWRIWHEAYLLPGDQFNEVVLRQFSEANVIVLLLTAKFFASDDKWDLEMSRAIERHQQGNALIVGIVVSPCMWEETPFRLVQMLPRDGVTVNAVGNRDGVWKEVVKEIQGAIGARERSGQEREH
jgi:GTPase SAR1 family protein